MAAREPQLAGDPETHSHARCRAQELLADAPSECATASAPALAALNATLGNGSAWADGVSYCGSAHMALTAAAPGPQPGDCLTLPGPVRAWCLLGQPAIRLGLCGLACVLAPVPAVCMSPAPCVWIPAANAARSTM